MDPNSPNVDELSRIFPRAPQLQSDIAGPSQSRRGPTITITELPTSALQQQRDIASSSQHRATKEQPDPSLFRDDEAEVNFEHILRRKILAPEMILDYPSYASAGVLRVFQFQEWHRLLTDQFPIFPRLVQFFYANLLYDVSTNTISSLVQNRRISFSAQFLSEILKIPNYGYQLLSLRRWTKNPYSISQQYEIVMGDNEFNTNVLPLVHQLPNSTRVIYRLLVKNIFPHISTFGHLKYSDMFFLSLLLTDKQINLPQAMILHMSQVHARKLSLPYGAILTRIFEYFQVDFSNEEIYPCGRSEFTTAFLNQTLQGRPWTRKKKKKSAKVMVSAEIQSPIPPPYTPPTHTIGELYNMLLDLNSKFDRLEQGMQIMEHKIDSMQQQLSKFIDIFKV